MAAVFNASASSGLLHLRRDDRFAYAIYNMLPNRAGVRSASGSTTDFVIPGKQKSIAMGG